MFFSKKNGSIEIVAVRIVDDVLITGETSSVQKFIRDVKCKYELGTVVYGPTEFLFFGLQVIQDSDMAISIHGDCKLSAVETFPIDRHRLKQISEPLKWIELRSFHSTNSSIGWLGTNASLFCAFYSSWLLQKCPKPAVEDLISQINSLKLLRKLGTKTHYKKPGKGCYKISVLVFADASKKDDHVQLCYLSGLLFDDLQTGSVFHALSWCSRKSRRPVKSIASAETLAACKAIGEGEMLVKAISELLDLQIGL